MLHRIENSSENISGIDLNWLRTSIKLFKSKGFRFLTLVEFRQHFVNKTPFPSQSILVTIDDGYSDQVDQIAPIFISEGIKPAVFLITDLVDKKQLPWDEQIRFVAEHTQENYIRFMHLGGWLHYYFQDRQNRTWARRDFIARCELLPEDLLFESINNFSEAANVAIPEANYEGYEAASLGQILSLAKQGTTFSSHTSSHCILSSNNNELAQQRIDDAKSFFESNGFDSTSFAYPVGKEHSLFERTHLPKNAGYDLAFSTIEGFASLNEDRFQIPRVSYPLNEEQLNALCAPEARYRFDSDNWLIKLNNIRTFKVLINEFGGKAAFLTWIQLQLKLRVGFFKRYQTIDFTKVNRVIFFCKGNINRSAVAETVFKAYSKHDHASFGLKTEKSFPPSVEAQRWSRKNKIDILHHKTTRIENFEVKPGDLLVGFEPEQIQYVENLYKEKPELQYTLLGIWAKKPWAYIHDPVARPEQYFDKCLSIIENASRNLAKALEATTK